MKSSIRWATAQRSLLSSLGIDIERCFFEAGITRDQWSDSSAFIEQESLRSFFESCLAAYGDPFLGILMGDHFSLSYSGFLGLALMSAPTFEAATNLALELPGISGLQFPVSKRVTKDEFILALVPESSDRNDLFTFLCNYNLAGCYKAAREIADDAVRVRKVRFMHGDEKSRKRYEAHFGCGVQFNTSKNEIAYPIAAMNMVPPRCDPAIFSFMYERCRSLNKRIFDEERFEDRVEWIVLNTEGQGWSIESIASRLHVSTRTLKRRLESEGTSFSQLMSRLRERLAKEYLSHTEMKIDNIASELGYSNGSNFGQAFKQWVGVTPSEYRRLHSGE